MGVRTQALTKPASLNEGGNEHSLVGTVGKGSHKLNTNSKPDLHANQVSEPAEEEQNTMSALSMED